MTESSHTQVLIVGGGIGGMTAALACARRGLHVRVLEQAPEITEIGGGLQLGPNAGRVMQQLGVYDALLPTAVLPERFEIRDVYSGDLLHRTDFAPLAERFGAAYTLMHRADLLDALFAEALATGLVVVEVDKRVEGLTNGPDSASVTCADGSTWSGDVVIGADGLRSAVRRLTFDPADPVPSMYVLYRGPGPRGTEIDDAVVLYTGEAMHLMQYPMHGGEMVNRVLSFKSTRGEAGSDTWGSVEEMNERFATACPHVLASLDTLDLSKRWVQFDRAPKTGWSQGRVTVLGDAAHPMYQYLAQGAAQAMEDSVVLAECLATIPDAAEALQRYEAQRFERASAVQRNARFFGEFTHLGGVAAEARNYFLRRFDETDYSPIEWLWGTDPVAPPRPSTNLYASAGDLAAAKAAGVRA